MLFLQTPDVAQIVAADSTMRAKVHSEMTTFLHLSPEDMLKTLGSYALEFLWKVIVALAIYYIGRWIIRKIKKVMKSIFIRRNVDSSLSTFLINLVSIVLTILLLTIIIGQLGLNTSSFIAIFASAGLAFGLALSGTLQNFAGGVMVLLLKPFHVGDYIEAQGQGGTVKAIQLFNTAITTSDNKTILIPNGALSTGIINNYSKEATRRVDWSYGIAHGDSFEKAKALLSEILAADKRILTKPESLIEINSLDSSAIHIVVRAWVKSDDYWDVYFAVNKKVYETFPANGINFPHSGQLDVTLTK